MKTALPKAAGSYILCLKLKDTTQIQIGKLGVFDFKKGFYFYVGSAFGPGGIQARCGHHIKISNKPRWHIDYLRKHCALENIIYSDDPQHLEHQWASMTSAIDSIETPAHGFGSSDCKCQSHLFFSNTDAIDNILNNKKYHFKLLKEPGIS